MEMKLLPRARVAWAAFRSRPAVQVFLLSLALRLTWVGFAHVTPVSDFRGYDSLAVRWLMTGGFGSPGWLAYRTPGYPGFLAGVYFIFGHHWGAAAFVQAILGGVSSALVVGLAGRIVSPRASLIAGLLHALSPTSLAYVPVLASENLAVPLLLLGLLLLVSGRRRMLLAAASGAVFGLLILVRPAAVAFLPAWVLLAAYDPRSRRLRILPAAAGLVACLAVLSPWLVRNHRVGLGAFTLSTSGGVNAWMGNHENAQHGGYSLERPSWVEQGDRTERERDRAYWQEAIGWARAHPRQYLALCVTRAARLLGAEPDRWAAAYLTPSRQRDELMVSQYGAGRPPSTTDPRLERALRRDKLILAGLRVIISPLILLAAFMSLRRWRDYAIALLPAFCYLGALSLSYAQMRFRELADPLLFIPLAALLSDLLFGGDELGAGLSRRRKATAALLLVSASLALHATGIAQVLCGMGR